MKSVLSAALALFAFSAPVSAARQGLELRFCLSAQVRTYPLESRRGTEGLLLQNVAVINRSASPVKVYSVAIELLCGGEALGRCRAARWSWRNDYAYACSGRTSSTPSRKAAIACVTAAAPAIVV